MSTTMANIEYPRLRHCTLVERNDTDTILMIVGTEHFEIGQELGTREQFLSVKRYFDGRHSIAQISELTGVPESDIQGIVESFEELGLLRIETALDSINRDDFIRQIKESCIMWSQQIGYHRLFGGLEKGEFRKEVFIGLLLETYHYVKSAPRHTSAALASCSDDKYRKILTEYFVEEYDHADLVLRSLEAVGIPREQTESAHPIIGTMSLINMMCEIGRQSSLAYLTCTSLFEARKEDYEPAKASFEGIARTYGFNPSVVAPILEHMHGDVLAGHTSLLEEALQDREYISPQEAHFIVNCLHDLKHSFDQFHDQIIEYYSDISNYIPRLKVDYFSL